MTRQTTTMILATLSLLVSFLSTTNAFLAPSAAQREPAASLHMTKTTKSNDDPCWQSFLDDDCNMSTMYASNFVAGKWIKSLPCGEGIEDCDMPTELMTPELFPDAGVNSVDVMSFLKLKRVVSPTEQQ